MTDKENKILSTFTEPSDTLAAALRDLKALEQIFAKLTLEEQALIDELINQSYDMNHMT
jgi:hypothetical protein